MIRFLLLFYITIFQQAEPIKAISYNIRYNNPKDGINVWENRRETVASILKEENADFVGLQEVVYPQLNDLMYHLKTMTTLVWEEKTVKQKENTAPFSIKKKSLRF